MNLKVLSVALLALAVATTVTFTGCKKEESTTVEPAPGAEVEVAPEAAPAEGEAAPATEGEAAAPADEHAAPAAEGEAAAPAGEAAAPAADEHAAEGGH